MDMMTRRAKLALFSVLLSSSLNWMISFMCKMKRWPFRSVVGSWGIEVGYGAGVGGTASQFAFDPGRGTPMLTG